MSQTNYEMLYILNPVLTDEQVKAEVDRINAFITDNGGTLHKVDSWGLKQMAYAIDKKRNGYYVSVLFAAPGPVIAKMKRLMEISDNHLRYLILKFDANMTKHYAKSGIGEPQA